MRVHHGEGVATHIDPESCAGIREGTGEALTGVRIGQATEPRKKNSPGCRRRSNIGRQNGRARYSRVPGWPGVVEDPHMGIFESMGENHSRMRITPVPVSVSKVRAQLHDLVVSSPDQPHIRSPLATAAPISRLRRSGLRRTRPFWHTDFQAMGLHGSSTWIRQD